MERRSITVRGIVQGVGFRPFVHALAAELGLGGSVKNQGGDVRIEVEGPSTTLDRFVTELRERHPPLAQLDRISWSSIKPMGDQGFVIASSEPDTTTPVLISADVATCRECLAELHDPADRRYHYPFLNCTHCGPRLTIITGSPYDRQRTTMAAFEICEACRAEYEDPQNRRFHAQPTACPTCGPQLQLVAPSGQAFASDDPLADFAAAIRAGQIGALKGLGGYHLICDARNEQVVAELRRRKHRDEKPLAIMVASAVAAEALGKLNPLERQLLESPRAPIVLLRKHALSAARVTDGVAPGNPCLGVMLPYTPLHHLLMDAVGGIPLVATSGNRSDEPVVYEDEDAIQRLADIADVFLIHNRPIHLRCDDSVIRIVAGVELPIRRSRGYAPQPIHLPHACQVPTLAVGGQLKATFALGRDWQGCLSQHLGDLDHFEAYRAFERDIRLYEQLFGVRPTRMVHDLHPDYASTRYARERAAAEGLTVLAVQHHHAHLASCMTEHGLDGLVIGVTFDGTGYGTDGAVWGGEFLVGGYREFRRAAHLRYVGMPGGDQAIREPWRMATAHLIDAECDLSAISAHVSQSALRTAQTMLLRRLNSPFTSSMGRLFDAIAMLATGRSHVSYEGQAAIELEWLASQADPDRVYPYRLTTRDYATEVCIIDTRPLILAVADDVARGVPAATIARCFHSTVAEMIAEVCGQIRKQTAIDRVALSGGVFLNALLTEEAVARLTNEGFVVYRHRLVPPGDGGLSLGQLVVAAAQ
jgi:hydrogenase maturation protein HypF